MYSGVSSKLAAQYLDFHLLERWVEINLVSEEPFTQLSEVCYNLARMPVTIRGLDEKGSTIINNSSGVELASVTSADGFAGFSVTP